MAKKKSDPFVVLSWNDLRQWAGSKILSRGKSYHRQKLVSDLAVCPDGSLLAWVAGTHTYATQVSITEDGLPESICSCPYGYNCKHGVAVVLEYLEQVEKGKKVPKAKEDDKRISHINEETWLEGFDDLDDDFEDEPESKMTREEEVKSVLKGMTKPQLSKLVLQLAETYPKVSQELIDRKNLASGNVKSLIKRTKGEISNIDREPDFYDYRNGFSEEYMPDCSIILSGLKKLLDGGHNDEIVSLGKEIVKRCYNQAEMYVYEHYSISDINECLEVVMDALDRSSLSGVDRLELAVDVIMDDGYSFFEGFEDYLGRKHAKSDWSGLADKLIKRLSETKRIDNEGRFDRDYSRDRIVDWIICAFEKSGRDDEIIPLCEKEAPKTQSYPRLVKYLIADKQYKEAEEWIEKGVIATDEKLPGIASNLRSMLKDIRSSQKDWMSVATMQAEEFVRRPSTDTYNECKKASTKTKMWPKVKKHLLEYLEKGKLPWKQNGWPLGNSNLSLKRKSRCNYPMYDVLIDIAIMEKLPEQVLFWVDKSLEKKGYIGVSKDKVATAIEKYAPERSVQLWKTIAEGFINQTKPSAYEQADIYLNKAEKVMKCQKKLGEWKEYLNSLRGLHARKRRFIEILDQSDSKPIIKKK